MERKNRSVETNRVGGTGENAVTPTHVFVRLGPEQRVRVPLPMSQEILRVLAAVAPKRG